MRASRRIVAIGVGLIQIMVGLVVAVVSIESIGLVTGDNFELNWPVAILAVLVLGTVGVVVALVAGRSDSLVVGAASAVAGVVLGVVATLIGGSLVFFVLVFAVVQVVPAMLPSWER